MTVRKLLVAFTTFALLISATATTVLADTSGSAGTQSQLTLKRIGTTHIVAGTSSVTVSKGTKGEIGPDPEQAGGGEVHGGGGTPPALPTVAPKPKTQNVVDATGTTHYAGLNHFDQRFAGTGAYANTQFSLEPPDQGLCVGKGFVVETINTAIRVRNAATGALLTNAEPLNQFFNLAPEIIRADPLAFGDFTSDPKCYFDPANGGHWFMTLLQLGVVPATGAFIGHVRGAARGQRRVGSDRLLLPVQLRHHERRHQRHHPPRMPVLRRPAAARGRPQRLLHQHQRVPDLRGRLRRRQRLRDQQVGPHFRLRLEGECLLRADPRRGAGLQHPAGHHAPGRKLRLGEWRDGVLPLRSRIHRRAGQPDRPLGADQHLRRSTRLIRT